jgi:hypothetical protein
MSNSELFKQAIAEAKAVREAAIANAKAALEETITPHIKELLAAKLQEMDSADDDEEEYLQNETAYAEDGMGNSMTEAEEEKEEAEEEEKEGEEEKEEDEEIDLEDMSIDDLKGLIRDLISQEMGEEGEMEADAEMGAEMDAVDDMGGEEEEVIDLDELLAELAEMEGKKRPAMEASAKKKPEMEEGMGNVLTGIKNMMKTLASNDKNLIPDDFFDKLNKATDIKALQDLANIVNKSMAGGGKPGTNVGAGGTGVRETQELREAKKTVETLRKDLHEVNLLNSKLLYVNKIFKAKNLSEGEKVNVIAAFDKATTVKETKLVYETLSEQFAKGAKRSVNEVKGFASKPVGGSAPKREIISEDATVKRLQKLAGIIK